MKLEFLLRLLLGSLALRFGLGFRSLVLVGVVAVLVLAHLIVVPVEADVLVDRGLVVRVGVFGIVIFVVRVVVILRVFIVV